MSWRNEAKNDIGQWSQIMPKDADGAVIDWAWIGSLDLDAGIGCFDEGEETTASPQRIHDALKADYATRDRLEPVIAQCNTAFMTDFDRIIASYRLPRALAYANRRLNDEIDTLLRAGESQGLWKVSRKRQGRGTAVVLGAPEPGAHIPQGVDITDIRDRTADILNERAERRKAERAQRQGASSLMAQASLSGIADGDAATGAAKEPAPRKSTGDWRNVYLPGRDVDTVMGIDIETTGTDPARTYIIDVGFEYMNMASPRPDGANGGSNGGNGGNDGGDYAYEQSDYVAGDAYGQSRLSFGVTERNARIGNPFIAKLTGIDVSGRGPENGYRLFDEWQAAQAGLLQRLMQQPYVAHNATFEHGFFMLNVAGYAEAYRAGGIVIIDTMPMSRQWDPGSEATPDHPYGDNTLDAYAKRQGALAPDRSERHLGLEDAHIMLVAMKRHLGWLREQGKGPWGADGRAGVGGKQCGRRS
ncbi:DNA polymerase III subunit epsilon [Bifidobacterium sp. 64T4]|uniref:DNA polymerase III subunit epsilon n=1 Tax=Bifidobacterium pongonis TaxID=2834432 RepID=UPI001C58FD84|nr:DNA polymerase III subunit epsilon [Bifidobacterium pongonis]MBW3094641.1 DNA polymerase III subunit epsilon [Bifidobacterium pongonis]